MPQPQSPTVATGNGWIFAYRNPQGQVVYAENVDGSVNLTGVYFPDGTYQTTAGAGGGFLPLAGGTLTGPLTISETGSPAIQFPSTTAGTTYGGAPFGFTTATNTFNGTTDNIFNFGYNPGAGLGGKAQATWQIEVDYNDGTHHVIECHYDYSADGITYHRPLQMYAALDSPNFNYVAVSLGSDPNSNFSVGIEGDAVIPLEVKGHLLQIGGSLNWVGVDNTYDIGAANQRPRNLICGGNGTFGAAGTAQTGTGIFIGGTSTQGPNFLTCQSETGVIFAVSNVGGLTITQSFGMPTGTGISFGSNQGTQIFEGLLNLSSTGNISWSIDSHAYDSKDTSVSRSAAGIVAIGTGSQGSVAGTLYCSTVKFSTALVALGGGTAPTLGTIGGSGPATAAQNTWLLLKDSAGASFWVPAWK